MTYMAVLNFREDRIAKAVYTPGCNDPNGDWHNGEMQWGEWLPCDAEPAGNAATRPFADGVIKAYQYTVHLNPDSPTFTAGERVRLQRRVTDDIQEFTVLGFQRYHLKSKLWL